MDETGVLVGTDVDAAPSFETFYGAESARLFRALRLVTGDGQEAEEIVQEAFVRVWERWERVGAMSDPTGYLYRTAMNLYRRAYRRALRSARRAVRITPTTDPADAVEARDLFVRWLRNLTPRQRQAVVLTEFTACDIDRAARVLGIKPGTVRVLISQARAALGKITEETDD